MKIEVTLKDTFSFSNTVKVVPYTKEIYDKLDRIFKSGGTINHFDKRAQIAYTYKIKKIKTINK